ncbi:D-aminoacyl-tRNA deacylase [Anditalea andensis]|uniref:D-aminoacyl-tRNA deacylase n=1 Tax=Anditalea andensis TaxID=1048983 RepID=A0A074L4M7_9BACT|nr:D-aminoacyl-tRNA deacylase [Anditalea andensis]KEO74818.1 D-tyrosyl-tRNA(Tyr) deacylase [Anditalea andensis]
MIAVIQRASKAEVEINGSERRSIGKGLVILLGIEEADTDEDVGWLSKKIINLRIFPDCSGVMNESVLDQQGEILLISQFTLHASTKKGNRPSYIKAAKSETAIPMYEKMIKALSAGIKQKITTGQFGADMQVSLTNDGPVTIIIDSKNKI